MKSLKCHLFSEIPFPRIYPKDMTKKRHIYLWKRMFIITLFITAKGEKETA